MSIRIRKIELKNCGPLIDYNLDPSLLTVLYAENERGKTTIVENIVNALFRRKKGELPIIREEFLGGCKVSIEGVGEGAQNYQGGKKTLDDFLETPEVGLPRSLLNLLFVRGAETAISPLEQKVSRAALKDLFSRQRVYDAVEASLPNEIGYTELADGVLGGQNRGDNKRLREVRDKINALRDVEDRFHKALSRTDAPELEREKEQITRDLELQQRAKRHYAYELKISLENTERDLAALPEEQLQQTANDLHTYRLKSQQLEQQRKNAARSEQLEEQARWLESAKAGYQRFLSDALNPVLMFVFAAVLVLSAAGALVSAFLFPLIVTVILIGVFLVLIVVILLLVAIRLRQRAGPFRAQEELKAIAEEFNRRFDRQLTSLADLETQAKELQDHLAVVRHVATEAANLEAEMNNLRHSVSQGLSGFHVSTEDESIWEEELRKLQKRRQELEKTRADTREKLSALGVDQSDLLDEDPGVRYSRQEQDELRKRLAEVKEAIDRIHQDFEQVSDDLADHIEREVIRSGSLSAIALAMKQKREEYRQYEREVLAHIIAGHLVNGVLNEFRKAEDEEIERMLNDAKIGNLVQEFTGKYKRLSLSGDELIVHGDVEQYPLKTMSTGAQEQILLALRIGIAELLSGGNPLFLILDDAFQYSDWNRRESLISETVAAVKRGWQVLYFTMDNHIRRRFEVIAARELPESSCFIGTL